VTTSQWAYLSMRYASKIRQGGFGIGVLALCLSAEVRPLPTYACKLRPDSGFVFLKRPFTTHDNAHGYDCIGSRRVAAVVMCMPSWRTSVSIKRRLSTPGFINCQPNDKSGVAIFLNVTS
jgi:hypothetical protein